MVKKISFALFLMAFMFCFIQPSQAKLEGADSGDVVYDDEDMVYFPTAKCRVIVYEDWSYQDDGQGTASIIAPGGKAFVKISIFDSAGKDLKSWGIEFAKKYNVADFAVNFGQGVIYYEKNVVIFYMGDTAGDERGKGYIHIIDRSEIKSKTDELSLDIMGVLESIDFVY